MTTFNTTVYHANNFIIFVPKVVQHTNFEQSLKNIEIIFIFCKENYSPFQHRFKLSTQQIDLCAKSDVLFLQ